MLCGWADVSPHTHVVGKQGVCKQLGIVDRDRNNREEGDERLLWQRYLDKYARTDTRVVTRSLHFQLWS